MIEKSSEEKKWLFGQKHHLSSEACKHPLLEKSVSPPACNQIPPKIRRGKLVPLNEKKYARPLPKRAEKASFYTY